MKPLYRFSFPAFFAALLTGLPPFAPMVLARERLSADYAITAETVDFGGGRATSADYTCYASISLLVGPSSEPASPAVARSGYIGQLHELLGYTLLASDYAPTELGATQLFPARTADDGTWVVVPSSDFTFNIVAGPLASVAPDGLVTAGAVYENTPATVGAVSPFFAGEIQLQLEVRDTAPDNFGPYAGDGLGDSWQVRYFGAASPLAGPERDPDGDGQTNLFEFTAGLVPTDAASTFHLRIEVVPGAPEHRKLVFGPRFSNRIYTVKSKTELTAGTWEELPDSFVSDDGPERTVIDPAGGGAKKFYHIEITAP